MSPIRVVLVDDQHLVRTGLRALLDRAPDIEVVGEAGDGRSGLAVVREQRPDIVLMDVRMPGGDGLEATRRILTDPALDGVQVLMLTTFDDDEYLFEAIRAGAAGFLLKDTPPDALRDAVRTVAGGDALLSPAVTRRVLAAAARSPVADPARLAGLTARERDVLAQVGAGRSNTEIGQALFLSPDTARTYVSRLLQKLNARDRAQLVVIAYESGLVRPGEG
ncbi:MULTISPECIES: response regulator transcription factor [unclassified Micromonospora]|uniref:response regulator n=1 Tax=unclassified Micromonospora TaxID=2617518 RepID=UPI0003EECC96|nr:MULTISPECIES: response regulator transcription factor [unclassified Micromonospora]EWM65743.1 two-component system response regulator [Micromonospora sp. M42]MCK1807162.1 response regulator transcription factor [Micromonospora sp. R42106]MCK1832172.1 response regulator transcription factor [Micromonospora sp. R42003]MCK1843493.1 response regulator transcription factor [Micromonospora sp. R42004]MCM1019949.1 response regulator transcription factor [Micromonospora sp. XM-20-01]